MSQPAGFPPVRQRVGYSVRPKSSGSFNILASSEGSGLVLIMVLLSIAAITTMGVVNIGGIQRKTRTQNMLPYHAQIRRGNIANLLRDSESWKKTIADSSNGMGCIKTAPTSTAPSTCALNGPFQPIRAVWSATGTSAVYNLNNASWSLNYGITPTGEDCTTFPSQTCPVSIQALWRCTANCTSTTVAPTIQIQVAIKFNPNLPPGISSDVLVAFNADAYGFTFDQNNNTGKWFFKP